MRSQIQKHPSNSPTQRFLLQPWTQISRLRDTTTLCPSPRGIHHIPIPQSIIGLPIRLRTDFSNLRDSRGHRTSDSRTISSPTLHGQIFLAPHITLQHNRKNVAIVLRQTTCLSAMRLPQKFGTILGLILPYIAINLSDFCNHVPRFLYEKLIELGAESLATRVLTADAISEVTQ